MCCLQETHFSFNDTQAQSKVVKKDISYQRNKKEQGQLISDKIVFKQKTVTKDSEGIDSEG